MKKFLFTALVCALGMQSFAYEKSIETLVPKATLAFAQINDVSKYSKLDDAHPFKKFWKTKVCREFYFGDFFEDDDEDEKTSSSVSIDDALEEFVVKHCKKRVALSLIDVKTGAKLKEGTKTKKQQRQEMQFNVDSLSLAIFVDCTASFKELEELAEFIHKEDEEVKSIIVEEFEKTPYLLLEIKKNESKMTLELYATVVDGMLVLANKKEFLCDCIAKIKVDDQERGLLANNKYMDSLSSLEKTDFILYANLERAFNTLIFDKDMGLLKSIENNPQLKAFISTDAIRNDLHLDAFSSFFAAAKVHEKGLEVKLGYTVKSQEGLAKVFTYGKAIPEIPNFAFDDYKSMSVSAFDWSTSLIELEKLLRRLSPSGMMMVDMQAGPLYKEFKDSLINNLEPYVASFSAYADNEKRDDLPASVWVLKVKDAQAAKDALAALMMKKGMVKKEYDFLGEKVYQFKNFPKIPGITRLKHKAFVSLVDQYLVVTMTEEDDMWRRVIAQIKKPGRGIDEHRELVDMWDSLPDGEIAMDYEDLGQQILNAYFADKKIEKSPEGLRPGIHILASKDAKPKKKKPLEKPDVSDVHYSIISKTYQKENIWYMHYLLGEYDPSQK